MDCSRPGLPVPLRLPEFAQVHVHCISDAIQPSHPLMPSSPSTFSLSQQQGLFLWVDCSHQVTKILELQLQHQSFQWVFKVDFLSSWLVWSLRCPRDSEESSLAPQFEGISSLVFSLFYCPALTSVHDCWKNHSFDYVDLCRQSSSKEQASFKFMAAVTISNDFGAQENKICHCFPI